MDMYVTKWRHIKQLLWTHKVLTSSTTETLEMRICADGGPNNDEDIPIAFYEIFVK